MKLFRKLRSLFRRDRLDRDMAEEMRFHLDERTDDHVEDGMRPDEARAAANRKFGGMAQIQEEARDARALVWIESLVRDVRYAARGAAKARGFSVVAVTTLALGIGITAAVFSVVYGVLLKPYPYAQSNGIWVPEVTDAKTGRPAGLRVSDYQEIARLPGVAAAMATATSTVKLKTDLNPEIIVAPRLTSTAFDFLGVPALLGRGFGPVDFKPGGEPEAVVVLSYRLWQRLFNGDSNILGRTLTLNDESYSVIGVMPPRFGWYTNNGLWLPLDEHDLQRGVRPIVRLRSGVTAVVANQQLKSLAEEIGQRAPGHLPKDGYTIAFRNYLEVTIASGNFRSSLLMLFGAVGFLLLIACVNVANLQLARGTSRAREIAMRLALGAGRGRLMRQLLTESLGLALVGGVFGVLLAYGLIQLIVALMPDYYVPNEARVMMNGAVLQFTLAIAMLTGVVFGLVPAWQCSRPDLNEILKDGGNAHGSGTAVRGSRTRNTLVVVEVALSVILLVGAALTIEQFVKLQRIDPGYQTDNTLWVRVPLTNTHYATIAQRNRFSADYLERIRSLPDVVAATVGSPPSFDARSGITIPGEAKPTSGVEINFIDTDYLQTLNLPLREGRNLTAPEVARGDHVALVSEAAARLWSDGKSPLGRTISVDALVGGGTENLVPANAVREVTVIGVVADTRLRNLRVPPVVVFLPYTLRAPLVRHLIVRTRGGTTLGTTTSSVVPALRAALRSLDPELPIQGPLVMYDVKEAQVMGPRFNMTLFNGLAGVALALAAAGIYAVMSYAVAQRTREFGVRMALGAQRHHVLRLVLGGGGKLVALGLLIGFGSSAVVIPVVRSQVFEAPHLNWMNVSGATVLLGLVAFIGCWLPAHRATKVDPVIALRAE